MSEKAREHRELEETPVDPELSPVPASSFEDRYRQAVDDRRHGLDPLIEPMFTPAQVVVMGLLFGPLGGSGLIVANCRRAGRPVWALAAGLLGVALAPVAPYALSRADAGADLAVWAAGAIWALPALLAGFFVHVNQGAATQGRSWVWAVLLSILWSFAMAFVLLILFLGPASTPARGAW